VTAAGGYLTGVQDGWHAIDPAGVRMNCGLHHWAVCGKPARMALVDDGSVPRPYDPAAYPVKWDPCPDCSWSVAARTGDLDAAVAALAPSGDDLAALLAISPRLPMLANLTAGAIVAAAADDDAEPDDPATLHLLAAVSRHAPVLLASEACTDGECGHHGRCPGPAACRACSLQAGDWAGEWQGQYMRECTIPAPCAVLLALAVHFGVTEGASR
jgi:hypothetical protein